MRRYFFDMHDGETCRDEAGMILVSDEAARHEAYSILSRYAANPINLIIDGILVVTVRNGRDSEVLTLRLICQEDRFDSRNRTPCGSDVRISTDRKIGAISQ